MAYYDKEEGIILSAEDKKELNKFGNKTPIADSIMKSILKESPKKLQKQLTNNK